MERLYSEIGKQLEGLYFKDGGPIVGIQLENELQHSAAPWAFSYPGQPTGMDRCRRQAAFHARRCWPPGETKSSRARRPQAHVGIKGVGRSGRNRQLPCITATGWGNAAVLEDACIPVTSAYPYPTWAKAEPSPLYLYKDLRNHPDYSPISYQPQRYPSFGAELGGGIMITYSRRPTVSARSLEALIVRELGGGANAIGYYMFTAEPRPAANSPT